MAMRGRTTSGTGVRPRTPSGRPRTAPVVPVFEDFKPLSDWNKEEDSDILLLYLPGFFRENIKVSTEGRNTLRVRGERLVTGNKWNRFQEDFQVPEKCNMRGIRAKFEAGILTVTMPHNDTFPSKASQPTDQNTVQSPPIPAKPAATEPKPDHKVQDDTLPEFTSTIGGNLATDGKNSEAPIDPEITSKPRSQMGQKEPAKPTSGTIKVKETDRKKSPTSGENFQQAGERKERAEAKEKPTESKIPGSTMEKTVQKKETSAETSKPKFDAENVIKGKEKRDGAADAFEKNEDDYNSERKTKNTTHVAAFGSVNGNNGGSGGGYSLQKFKKAVKGLTRELNEERQLVVNMGAAVLVLVALGAYILYTIGSSGKTDNRF